MSENKLTKLAEEITDYLFTNGAGEKARRLAIELEGGRNSGGWCREAVRDAVLKKLQAANNCPCHEGCGNDEATT